MTVADILYTHWSLIAVRVAHLQTDSYGMWPNTTVLEEITGTWLEVTLAQSSQLTGRRADLTGQFPTPFRLQALS